MNAPLNFSTPAGTCLYAIGDIHGRLDLLSKLMGLIKEDATLSGDAKEIIFLGDYVDRGPKSKEVLDFLMQGLPQDFKPIFLRGNHEDVMLRFLEGDSAAVVAWMQFGGTATLANYGVNPYQPGVMKNLEALQASFAERVPSAHKDFLASTRYFYESGDYYFVHAGVRPGTSLDRQAPEDQMWIRDIFLENEAAYSKKVIHGHSIEMKPDIHPYRIGIDTGAYATGHLTCLKLQGTEYSFITT